MDKLLLVIFVFLSFASFGQQRANHFDSTYFNKQRFAHRGGYANGPENTLQTILYNIEHGVTAVEIDVNLTKDNELVIFHDDSVKRLLSCDQERLVTDFTLTELKEIPLRDSSQGVQYVCSLDELIDTLIILIPLRERLDFLLEIDFKPNGTKTKTAVAALEKILLDHLSQIGPRIYNYFFVSSFYPDVLKELNKIDTNIVTAFAVNGSAETQKLKARLAVILAPIIAKKYDVDIFEPNMCMVRERYIRKWQRRGYLINTYSASTECEKDYLNAFHIAYTTKCPLSVCDPDPSDQLGKPKRWCKKCQRKKKH
ncbi:MAG: glycerophosphodiester phosphodiesterase [Crocinitomicaceae bacterium]